MSLIPLELLPVIMDSVSLWQLKTEVRLNLAVPASDLESYFDSRWLVDVIIQSEGLLLTLNIPLASQPTVFTFFEAKPLPQFFPDDPQTAVRWKKEAPFLAFSDKNLESPVCSEEKFELCLDSSLYRICS